MIRISRSQTDEEGNSIKPDAEWFARANTETTKALKEKKAHEANTTVYGDNRVRAALDKLFQGKCAYCECRLTRMDMQIEHFRPKGNVRECKGHGGYYWLAYDWSNLYPSCTFCNQRRKEKPIWGLPPTAISGGKADQFPLADESTRAMSPKDSLSKEKRLLIDPCADYPERHFGYTPTGDIYELRRSKKGKTSIQVFNLWQTKIRDDRKEVIDAVIQLIEMKKTVASSVASDFLEKFIKETYLADGSVFSGAARFVLNNPEHFGL